MSDTLGHRPRALKCPCIAAKTIALEDQAAGLHHQNSVGRAEAITGRRPEHLLNQSPEFRSIVPYVEVPARPHLRGPRYILCVARKRHELWRLSGHRGIGLIAARREPPGWMPHHSAMNRAMVLVVRRTDSISTDSSMPWAALQIGP